MNEKPLCIYHHGCADGTFAAWAVRESYGADNVDFHPGIYGEAPPDVTGRPVILVDFSYKREVMLQLAQQASSVYVIDHHESAERELKDLPLNVRTVFDMNRSGAMLTWNVLFPDQQAPILFDYVQDRDLWQHRLPNSREVSAAIYSHEMTLDIVQYLIDNGVNQLISQGRVLVRKQRNDIAAIVRDAKRFMWFGLYQIPVANVPWMYASDVAGELAKDVFFAATYYDDAHGRRWSLRSDPNGLNVAKIAEAFGGGGHEHAAGFRQTREEAIDFELAASEEPETVV